MKEIQDYVKVSGEVERIIEYADGKIEKCRMKNAILSKGREALAASIGNMIGTTYSFYISRMLFGDGGTVDGQTKIVNTSRNGLFGTTRASKPVISSTNPSVPAQIIFTSVLTWTDANGYALSEMALQMSNGDLYSMITFPDVTKTAQMQITYNWEITFC